MLKLELRFSFQINYHHGPHPSFPEGNFKILSQFDKLRKHYIEKRKRMPSLNWKLLDFLCKLLQYYLFTEKHVKHLLVTSPHLAFITKRVTMRNTMMIIMISR